MGMDWLAPDMRHASPFDIVLGNRVTVSVTDEIRDALGRAAQAQDLTPSDFIREAISDRLDRVGTPHTRVVRLRRRSA